MEEVNLAMALGDYSGLLWTFAFAVGAVLLLYLVQSLTSVSPSALTLLPFQSGWVPQEHALSRFHARWYPMTLVFLAFDVEMLFMYPWALVVADIGMSAVVEMFVFLGTLMLAVLWARREGAFRWV